MKLEAAFGRPGSRLAKRLRHPIARTARSIPRSDIVGIQRKDRLPPRCPRPGRLRRPAGMGTRAPKADLGGTRRNPLRPGAPAAFPAKAMRIKAWTSFMSRSTGLSYPNRPGPNSHLIFRPTVKMQCSAPLDTLQGVATRTLSPRKAAPVLDRVLRAVGEALHRRQLVRWRSQCSERRAD